MQLDTQTAQRNGIRVPLVVENQEPNMSVFAKSINGNAIRIQFAPKGHFGDRQRVPLDLAEDIDFLNSLEHGTLKVVGGPEDVVEALQFETEQIRADREEGQRRAQADVLDRRQDKDMVGVNCQAPRDNGREGICGAPLIQSAKQQGEIPPLCSQHAHLAPTFHLVEVGSKGEGATETRDGIVRREWRQAQMTPTVKQNL